MFGFTGNWYILEKNNIGFVFRRKFYISFDFMQLRVKSVEVFQGFKGNKSDMVRKTDLNGEINSYKFALTPHYPKIMIRT